MSESSYHRRFAEPSGFQFITSSGDPKLADRRQTIRTVKSHVMRRYQSKKRQLGLARLNASDITSRPKVSRPEIVLYRPPLEPIASLCNCFNVWCPICRNNAGENRPALICYTTPRFARSSLDASTLDPFDCLPIRKLPHTDILIERFVRGMMSEYEVPTSPHKNWFSKMLSDPLPIQACLAVTAMVLLGQKSIGAEGYPKYVLTREGLYTEYYRLNAGAVGLINESLSDSSRQCTDEVLAAITPLASIQTTMRVLTGEPNVHLDALRQLVEKRGGLQNLGMDGLLARKIYWIDRWDSWVNLSVPRLNATISPPDPTNNGSVGIVIDESKKSKLGTPDLVSSLDGVIRVSDALKSISYENEHRPVTMQYENSMQYSDELVYIEGNLTMLVCGKPGDKKTVEVYTPLQALEQSFYLASLIYIYRFLRHMSTHWFTHVSVLRRIKENILLFDTKSDFSVSQLSIGGGRHAGIVLLWVLFNGAIVARKGPQELWFLKEIGVLCMRLGLHSWEDVREHLDSVAWCERSCGREWRQAWLDAERPEGYSPPVSWERTLSLAETRDLLGKHSVVR